MAVTINASTSAGLVNTADTSGVLALQTAGTTAVTVDASQNVGIGITPSAWGSGLKVLQMTSGPALYGTSNSGVLANNIYYDGTNYRYVATSGASLYLSSTSGANILYSAASGTAGNVATFTQVFAVQKDQSLALQGASPATGTGIAFPATQSASSDANTLDDYEEGTWTPVIKFAGNNVGMTFSNQTGTYVKIGRQVIVWYTILLTAKGSSIGNAIITGVPFAASSYGHGVVDLNSGMTAVPATGGYGIIAGTDIYLRYNNTTGYADFNNTIFTNTSLIIGVVTYYVA
jgi:hypothetical protein